MPSSALSKSVFTYLIASLFISSAFSQSDFSEVTGRLVNSEQSAIVYSTVALYTADSALVKGEVSDTQGSFTIRGVNPGYYYLLIQNIEYADYYTDRLKVGSGEIVDVGAVMLSSQSVELEGVTVTGKRQLVEVRPDKMVFNVSSTVNASGNNGLELLSKAPGVMIDPDNNVILQGKSGVRIFINGRPTRLSGSDLTTFLQSLQSDNIEQIELITNPSARYEAEGNAGIINIKLKNNVNLGYNGNIVHSQSYGTKPRMSTGATINYGKGKLGVTANLTHFDNTFWEGFAENKIQSGYRLNLESAESIHKKGFNATTSITYDFNEKHSVNLSGSAIRTTGDFDLFSETRIVDLSDTSPTEWLVSQSLTDYQSANFNFNLNYLWKFSDSFLISMDASYGSFDLDNEIYQPNTYYEEDKTTVIREANNGFDPNTDIELNSIKTDVEKKMGDVTITTGAKYYSVNTANQFIVSDVVDEDWTVNESKTNTFNYEEEVIAVYLETDIKLSENLSANAGGRLEQTSSRGTLISTQATENDDVKRNYLNFFPNLSLAYKAGKSEISLGYGQRITRPNYQDLNPFEAKMSELAIWKGNPFLKPNYITNYQMTFSHNNRLVISNTFSITEGFFARLVEIVDETSTFIIPRNMRRSTTNGLSVSYPVEVSKWWEASIFAIYNRTTYQGDFDKATINIDANIYTVRVQNSFTLPWGISADLAVAYGSPWIWRGSIEIDGYQRLDVGLRKAFFDDQLQIRLTGSDILNTNSDYPYKGNYGGIDLTGVYSNDNCRFGFGLTYQFGNRNIKKQRKSDALDAQLKRIE
ncbi:MAG: TonB-dependent receptor [Cyclobacteriaceae bacterium]